MLAVKTSGKQPTKHQPKEPVIETVNKYTEVTEYDPIKNVKITKRQKKTINITKKIQETAKMLKEDKATQLLKELEAVYSK